MRNIALEAEPVGRKSLNEISLYAFTKEMSISTPKLQMK